MEIKVERAKTLKEKPDQSNFGFGKYFTDHMFVMDYDPENGWHAVVVGRRVGWVSPEYSRIIWPTTKGSFA